MFQLLSRIKFEALSDSESDGSEGVSVLQHYGGDTELPVYSTTPFGYHAEKLAKILLSPNHNKICHIQPLGVTRSASFVVDIDDVEFADLKADDMGVWKPNGTKRTHFKVLPSGKIWIASSSKGTSSHYVITRRYYTHGTYNRFRRIIVDIQGKININFTSPLPAYNYPKSP